MLILQEKNMTLHLLIVGAMLILIALCTFLWIRETKITLYRFRSVMLIAAAFAALMMLITALTDAFFPESGEESSRLRMLIRSFPGSFAHFSIWLMVIFAAFMFVSNLSLMKHEGVRPTNLLGSFLGVFFVAGTAVIYLLSRSLASLDGRIPGAWALFIARCLPIFFYCLLDYAECVMIGIIVMGYVASRQKPKYDKDFIIILGCSISKAGGLLPLLKGRTNRAIRYAWEQEIATGKKVLYVPSGGQGSDEIMSEGSAMELYLVSHSAEFDEVFPEKKSTNTYENFLFSKQIIDQQMPDAKIAFSTTNYHILRSGMIAHRLGIEAEGIASDTKWYFWPNGFAREVIAIFNMTRKIHAAAAVLLLLLSAVLALI